MKTNFLLVICSMLIICWSCKTVQGQEDINIEGSRIPEERKGNTDWFSEAGWGIFVHFLYDVQCVGDRIANTEEKYGMG